MGDGKRTRAARVLVLLGAVTLGLLAGTGPVQREREEASMGARAQEPASVVLRVTLAGAPADALVEVVRAADGGLVSLEYTDVRAPGEARFSLAPGDYVLFVSQGAGFTMEPVALEITAEPGAIHELSAELERRFDPRQRGYYGADLHAHSAASAPAMERDFGIRNHGVTPVDQLVAVQRAADLDVMFISDHNSVDGHELFARTAEERGLPYVLSEEITTLKWGHFNPYSLEPGALVPFSPEKLPQEYFAEARAAGAELIQINHPLDPLSGYLLTMKDPAFDDSFDVVEAMNGAFEDDDFYAVERLFRFWNEGRRYVAVAVSDDHDWKEPGDRYGSPRTYVHVEGELTAERFLDALQQGHVFATYGPLVYVTANGSAIPGDSVPAGEPVRLEVQIESVSPLDGLRAEVVRGGRRVASFDLEGHESSIVWEDPEIPQEGSWYVVRLVDPERRYRALTNPIWVGR